MHVSEFIKKESKQFTKAVACCELLHDHFYEKIELTVPEQQVCATYIKKESKHNFFFFAKYVLEFDLMTEETHKVWAENLVDAFYSHDKIMRLKPRATYKCLQKGTPLISYGIDDKYNIKPAKLINQKDFFAEGIKVTLKSGRSFVCTEDHPLKTITGWESPKVGMRVAVKRTLPNNYICKNEVEDYLIGILLGDGCLRGSTPRLSSHDPEVRLFLESKGYEIGWENKEATEYSILHISDLIKDLGLRGTSSHSKFIPKEYEGSSHLLRGLFDTDGHVSSRDACLVYSTVSEQLADDIVRNLHYFGIVARKKFYSYPASERSPEINAFQITITTNFVMAFYEKIGFGIVQKQTRLEEIVSLINDGKYGVHSNIDTIPKEWRSLVKWERNEKRDLRNAGIRIDNKNGTLRKKVEAVGNFLSKQEINDIANTDIFWDEILTIESIGKVEFSAIGSDIENYMTPDGIIHHNTTLYGVSFILWLWASISPELRIFYTSSNGLLLEEVSDKVTQFLNPEVTSIFQYVFGIRRDDTGKNAPKNTGDVFNIVGRSGKGFSLILRTAGGGTAGIHPNVIIVDDPCFIGETPVLTKTGYKQIKDICPGEFVLTRKGYKEVISSGITSYNVPVETYDINGSQLTMTPTHKIITENRGKVPVCDLVSHDIIIKYEDGLWKSKKLEKQKLLYSITSNTGDTLKAQIGGIVNIDKQRREDVYNLTIKDQHEFVANGLLVANCDRNDRESATVRKKKEHWFDSLTPLIVPYIPRDGSSIINKLIFIATRWHQNDLMDYIFKLNDKTKDWDIEIESIYNDKGTTNYPEFITDAKIASIKASISLVFFACQYMNDPLPEGLKIFNEANLHFVDFADVDIANGQKMCFFDPSQGRDTSDWPATVWTNWIHGKLTVIDALKERMELAKLIHHIARMNKMYGVTHMVFENNGSSLIKENLIEAHKKIGHIIQIDAIHHSTKKEERILAMQPDLYSGFCRFMKDWEERYYELMDQLLFFPTHQYDDFPDVLEMAVSHYRKSHFQFNRYEKMS